MRRIFLLLFFIPLWTFAQELDSLHIMVDAESSGHHQYVYKTFQEAVANLKDGTSARPMTVYICPGVYWVDDPDDPSVRVGVNGREPFGMIISCKHLNLIGLGDSAEDVVLASQRGQTQGAVGNFTMFDFWVNTLRVKNLTMGNYCNVDLIYPRNPKLNRNKRSDAITQAHVGYVHGDSLLADNVRFISRLNLNPLNGARYSYYEHCHFECTDDALNGSAIYENCNFDFYGQKPFWSTRGKGAMFINCDFTVKSHNREMFFTKQGGPVTIVNGRYHAPSDSIYIGWTPYPQPWLRCYQQGFTLNGKPYLIGSRATQNTVLYPSVIEKQSGIPFLDISQHESRLLTGEDSLILTCQEPVQWHVQSGYENFIVLDNIPQGISVIPQNYTDEIADFCVHATTKDGRQAACHLTVLPSKLPPPSFVKVPTLRQVGNTLHLDYDLDLQGRLDESKITWYRDNVPVATSHVAPVNTYILKESDRQHHFKVVVKPKHQRSDFGKPIETYLRVNEASPSSHLVTDFSHFYTGWQPLINEGLWTVDGYKPQDTSEYNWSFDKKKPMWEYAEGFNGAVGMGLLQAQRGARLMYTPSRRKYSNMSLELLVDPTKTAGQGFGSATGQYMDVCLKFDTKTLTGYGLRIIRTTKYAKAVDFLLVRYDKGKVTPISASVSSTCYRTDCTISIDFTGNILTAIVTTKTPRPVGSDLPHQVRLTAKVSSNPYGGIHIQHTGSCGESTTMLHKLKVSWD